MLDSSIKTISNKPDMLASNIALKKQSYNLGTRLPTQTRNVLPYPTLIVARRRARRNDWYNEPESISNRVHSGKN